MYPILKQEEPKVVEHAIIVDFSQIENSPSPAAKSKKSSSSSASKPVAKPVHKSVSTPKPTSPKPVKTEAKAEKVVEPQKTSDHEGEVVAPKVIKKEVKEEKKGPTVEEIAEAKRQEEKAAKKSRLSALLSRSVKKDNGAGEDDTEDSDTTKGASDSGTSNTNGHSNIRGVLGNRKVLKVPSIKDDSQKKGRVVVKICVDAAGDVISSTYTMMGSTTSDTYLIELAEKGAKGYKFSPSANAKECGKVVIDFLLK